MKPPALPRGAMLARVDDVPDAGALVVLVEQVSLILTRRGASVFAFLNRCPHAHYPLQRADGRVLVQEERYLICGAHGASFRLDDGACAGGPCNGAGLTRVRIDVREGQVRTD